MDATMATGQHGAIQARRRLLLRWYDVHARDLPWRRQPSLYGTWLAEIMLQQTTVATVTRRWPEFLARYPDVHALAEADQSDVLAAWSGLGYYRRARSLHEAARRLVAAVGGELPRTVAAWRALPGVGEYTAGAIGSIGLQQRVAAIDANVRRVMLRWHCCDPAAAAAVTPAVLRELADAHVPADRPGDWNQALMDLGAGLCHLAGPVCRHCPVRRWCAAGAAGNAQLIPAPVVREPATPVRLSVLVLRHADRVLLLPCRRALVAPAADGGRPMHPASADMFHGMLCLPATPWYRDAAPNGPIAFAAAWRRWLRRLGWPRPHVTMLGQLGHAITVYRLRVSVATAAWPPDLASPCVSEAVWAIPDRKQPLGTLAWRSLSIADRPPPIARRVRKTAWAEKAVKPFTAPSSADAENDL
jgi:A/G-specific adenine glycosylase